MKKIILSALAIAAFGFTSCSDDDDGGDNCVELGQAYADSYAAWMEDSSEENEQAMDDAEEAFMNADCPEPEVEVE